MKQSLIYKTHVYLTAMEFVLGFSTMTKCYFCPKSSISECILKMLIDIKEQVNVS